MASLIDISGAKNLTAAQFVKLQQGRSVQTARDSGVKIGSLTVSQARDQAVQAGKKKTVTDESRLNQLAAAAGFTSIYADNGQNAVKNYFKSPSGITFEKVGGDAPATVIGKRKQETQAAIEDARKAAGDKYFDPTKNSNGVPDYKTTTAGKNVTLDKVVNTFFGNTRGIPNFLLAVAGVAGFLVVVRLIK